MGDHRRIAWVMHPLKGDIPRNIARAKRWLCWLIRSFPRVDFAADWILWCEVLDDTNAAERERGLRFDEEMIKRVDEVWLVGGRITEGMERERDIARAHHKPIIDLTTLDEEPPSDQGTGQREVL